MSHPSVFARFAVAAVAIAGGHASGAVIIDVQEVGPDVVWTGSGSLDLSGFLYVFSPALQPRVVPGLSFSIGAATPAADVYALNPHFSGPELIGGGAAALDATGGVGALFGLQYAASQPALLVPQGYVSGAPLGLSTATYANQTFAGIGVAPGSYTWTWSNSAGATDSLTLNVLVPEPAGLGLLAAGGLVTLRRRPRIA